MLGGFGLGMVVHFLAQVVAGRAMGPEVYGVYGLVIYNAALITGFFDAGLAVAMTTYTADADAQNNGEAVGQFVRAGVAVEVAIVGLFLFLCLLFNDFITERFFQSSGVLVLFFVGLVVVQGFFGLCGGVISGLRELKVKALVRLIQQTSLLVGMVIFIEYFSGGSRAALSVQLFSISLSLFIIFIFIKRIFKKRGFSAPSRQVMADKKKIKLVVKTVLPVSAAFVAFSCIRYSGPVIVNAVASPGDCGKILGLLVVLLSLGRVADSLFMVIARSLFPYLIKWHAEGNQQRSGKYISTIILLLIGGYGVLILGSWGVGEKIIGLAFGRVYIAAARYLPGVFLVFGLFSVCTLSKIALYSIKQQGAFLVMNLIGLAVFVLSVLAGCYLFPVSDSIWLVLLSMGVSSLTITVMSFGFYRGRVEDSVALDFHEYQDLK